MGAGWRATQMEWLTVIVGVVFDKFEKEISILKRRDAAAAFFFFSSRRRHTRCYRDWSSDVCSFRSLNSELRFWLGWAQDLSGDHVAAKENWKQARSELELFLKEQPDNFNVLTDLALT